jgi:hypothetical protein
VDVMKAFNMPNLDRTLLDFRDGNYKRNKDYRTFFNRLTLGNSECQSIKKYIYLTYSGMLRVLFATTIEQAERFQKWAIETLFTHQMGSIEEKTNLGTDLLHIDRKTYKAVFDCYASKFPCIYLFSLGKVGVLRDTFGISSDINDDMTVYKYGFTDDLDRRFGEHQAKYGKLPNVTLCLSTFHIIDVKYTSVAEGDIRKMCQTFQKTLATHGYKELIVLDEKEQAQIKKQYKYIGNEYAGATAELQRKIKELEDKIRELYHQIVEKDLRFDLLSQENQTNKIIFELEKKNWELQLQAMTKKPSKR